MQCENENRNLFSKYLVSYLFRCKKNKTPQDLVSRASNTMFHAPLQCLVTHLMPGNRPSRP